MNTTKMPIASNRVHDIEHYIHAELQDKYPSGELNMFVRLLFEAFLGWDLTSLLLHRNDTIDQSDLLRFYWAVEDLKQYRPIQHIVGYSEFCGCHIKVSPDVLIPRPETAEIVEWNAAQYAHHAAPQRVADLCTGSGCIAIAMKRKYPDAHVLAVDISERALAVARQNANDNRAEVFFTSVDILQEDPLEGKYDLIVSNPPYICDSERQYMSANVLDYEPKEALFVPDEDPLRFYRRIGTIAQKHLKEEGLLVLEINEKLGEETCALLQAMGYTPTLHDDFNGRPRMVEATIRAGGCR